LLPVFVPFTFHWNPGLLPPLTGVAVNVTCVPLQKGLVGVLIVTLAGREALTVIVMELERTGLP
jgi:hypothetical protein